MDGTEQVNSRVVVFAGTFELSTSRLRSAMRR